MISPRRARDNSTTNGSRMQRVLPTEVRRCFEFSPASVQSISGISIILPVRGYDRQNNLDYCVSRLLLQNVEPLEIIVSEEDISEKITLGRFNNDSRVKKVFTQSTGRDFNKSIAVNAGFANSIYSKILMNDTDIVPPKGYLYRVSETLNEFDSCFFGKEIYNVDLLRNGIMWNGTKRTDYFSGGSIAFTRDAFIKIGGMCESFYGYGSEDCEFWGRITSLTKLKECRDVAFLHLNHKRANAWSVNADLYSDIMKKDIEQRLVDLKRDLNNRLGLKR